MHREVVTGYGVKVTVTVKVRSSYCTLVTFREVFFVNKVHRKPENLGAKSCECMISVHREACYCERSEQ